MPTAAPGFGALRSAWSEDVAQCVNSYKRLVPGYEAPVYVARSRRNRSALVLVPRYHPRKEPLRRDQAAGVGDCRVQVTPWELERYLGIL